MEKSIIQTSITLKLTKKMKDAVIIICGGGPAPGMNSVSMSVAKTFLTKNFRVIGPQCVRSC